MRMSGKYSSVEMRKNGGYVAIEKSDMKHKKEELELANFLGDKGYKVILKDEKIAMTKSGKTSDGYLYAATFEQKTPTSKGAKGINKCLEHAKQKEAELASLQAQKDDAKRREEFEKAKAEIGDKAKSDEDVLSYIAFPAQAEKFFDYREEMKDKTYTYEFKSVE